MRHWQRALFAMVFLVGLAAISQTALAQINEKWTESVSSAGIEMDVPTDLAIDSDGNLYITGRGTYTHGDSANFDYMTTKILWYGQVDWVRTVDSDVDSVIFSSDDYAFAVSVDQSDRIAVTGTRYYEIPGNSDIYTVLYDQDGDTIWTRRFASTTGSFDAGFDVVADDVYGVYVVGQSSVSGADVDWIVIRYDRDGDSVWAHFVEGPFDGNDYPVALAVDGSGQCYVTGGVVNDGEGVDIRTICYDTDGTVLWSSTFASDPGKDDEVKGIVLGSSGEVYVAGRAGVLSGASKSRSPQLASADAVLIKYDALGDTAWVNYYNGPANSLDDFSSIAISPDASLIAATGGSYDTGFIQDLFVAVYEPNGDTAWVRRWDSPTDVADYGWSVAFGRFDEVWVTGYTLTGLAVTFADVVVLRYSKTGELLNTYTYDGEGDQDEGLDIAFDRYVTGNMIVSGSTVHAASGTDFLGIGVFGRGPAIEVINTNPIGPGSFERALETSNLNVGPDSIIFTVAGTVSPTVQLPDVSEGNLHIDGLSAPGATPGNPTFTIDGSAVVLGHGLNVTSTDNTIRCIGITGFPGDGVRVSSPFTRNTITQCLIYDNGGLGIDVGGDGVTSNAPTIDNIYLASPGKFNISGTFDSISTIELYVADKYVGGDTVADPSGYGEGWIYLGETVTFGGTMYYFDSIPIDHWAQISVIGTDGSGSTSEFSLNRMVIPDSLIVTVYSPVKITVITPDSSDSIGRGFNTIGGDASYDSLTDWGVGPDGIPGEPDDQVVITNVQPGDYTINISTKPGESGDYFMGIRVDGTEEQFYGPGVTGGSSTPITNPAPPEGEPDVYAFDPAPADRGDLNGDGVLNSVDLNLIILMIFFNMDLPDPPDLADLNCDGVPNSIDLNILIQVLFFNGSLPCH